MPEQSSLGVPCPVNAERSPCLMGATPSRMGSYTLPARSRSCRTCGRDTWIEVLPSWQHWRHLHSLPGEDRPFRFWFKPGENVQGGGSHVHAYAPNTVKTMKRQPVFSYEMVCIPEPTNPGSEPTSNCERTACLFAGLGRLSPDQDDR